MELLPTAHAEVLAATWGAEEHSAASPEGVEAQPPISVAPLPQRLPSGLVRSQARAPPPSTAHVTERPAADGV